jgi:perosamine synthetase
MKIPMSGPDLTTLEIDEVSDVVASGRLSFGTRVSEFEVAIATYLGVPHAAAVNSGTAALHLAVISAGVKDSDLGITTPFSFVASSNCFLYERAIPVFVDVEWETGNIDAAMTEQAVEALLKGGREADRFLPPSMRGSTIRGSLKALLPVHAFGQPADMDPLMQLAGRHGLSVIEDACEAIGAEYKGRRVGTIGDAATFAFYPNKQMTTGEGGMLVTRHAQWDERFRSMRNQGRDVFDEWLNHSRLGFNYRLSELSAALGVVQMRRIDELLKKRETVAGWYTDRLKSAALLTTPHQSVNTTRTSWFVYTIRLDGGVDRRDLMKRLDERGIPTRPYFTPIHLQRFYQEQFGYRDGDFPVAEQLGATTLALPFSGIMTESEVDYVTTQLLDLVGGARRVPGSRTYLTA